MSYTPETLVACPNLQADINMMFGSGVVRNQSNLGLTQYLNSPLNRSGIRMAVNPGLGKIKTAEVLYQPRIVKGSSNTDAALTCTATTVRGNTSQTYTIDPDENLQQEQIFSTDTLAYMCKDNDVWFREQIAAMIAALDADVNVKNATQLEALAGGYSSVATGVPYASFSGDILQLQTEVPSGTDPFPQSAQALQTVAMMSNFGQFAVIGGASWYSYNQLMNAGCCADSGLDLRAIQMQFGAANVLDWDASTALGGAAYSFVLSNGAAQILTYNRWEGLFGISTVNDRKFTIVSPETGLKYDISIVYDCGNIHVVIYAITKVVALPLDLYQTGDELEGVNGVAKLQVVNV